MSNDPQVQQTPDSNRIDPEAKERGKSDDKCIGNRRVRTMILCFFLLIFSIFSFGYLYNQRDFYADKEMAAQFSTDYFDGALTAFNLIIAGVVFTMFFAAFLIILYLLPCDKCNNFRNSCLGRLPAIGLIIGSLLYIFGWVYYITVDKDYFYDGILSNDEMKDRDATYLSWFGEALLYSASAFLLAVDLLTFIFESEGKRLFVNLGVLAGISFLIMPAYFILSGDADGVEAIGTGYIIIFTVCIVYVILYILTCCTCDCKDKCLIRAALAITLIVGGIITACGYYVFAGGSEKLGASGSDEDEAKKVAYYIGYTILVGGLCTIWGLDIAWDDVKARDEDQHCCRGC